VGNGLRTAIAARSRRCAPFASFGSVADVDRVLRIEAHAAQRRVLAERDEAWFFGVAAADARGKRVPSANSLSWRWTRSRSPLVRGRGRGVRDARKDAPGACDEFRFLFGVIFAPNLVRVVPFVFRQFCGAIDEIPVRRIVLFELARPQGMPMARNMAR